MMQVSAAGLQRAVAAICPDIEQRVRSKPPNLNETQLWWELSCCLLSSQVSYQSAAAAADALARSRLLSTSSKDESELAEAIETVLRHGIVIDGKIRGYRFAASRAKQLAATKCAVASAGSSLSELVGSFGCAMDARNWLVSNALGIGPKQGSMFLRNSGRTYDLAIIDRHVLNYMAAIGIASNQTNNISRLAHYSKFEQELRAHADDLGISVGLLDWAIWIVMRAAKSSHIRGNLL